MNFVGRSVTRLEDRPLVTGNGCFAADVSFAHQLHMRVVRSSHAHARVRAIDTTAARNVPGVVAVWTIRDVDDLPPIDFRQMRAAYSAYGGKEMISSEELASLTLAEFLGPLDPEVAAIVEATVIAAVVGRPDELKGQALVCFVTLKNTIVASAEPYSLPS